MIRTRIEALLKEMNKDIYEKEEVMALSLLSAMAGESIFLLGDVGIAKSLVATRLKYVFKDSTSFEFLMTRYSTPDEIFGNISVSKLKNDDKYERITKGYLPSATTIFLDEIWKSGPSILNALLKVINERVFRNGDNEIRLPMKALISASNELPAKGESLEALWDRFLIRYIVVGIQDTDNFNAMIVNHVDLYYDTVSQKNKFSDKEYQEISGGITKVAVPANILEVIHAIRKLIDDYNTGNPEKVIHVSDRRWKKISRLLKACAFLNDRDQVSLIDCFIIVHCIWDHPEHVVTCTKFVSNAILQSGYKVSFNAISAIRYGVSEVQSFLSPEATATPQAQPTAPQQSTGQDEPAVFAGDDPLMKGGYYEVMGLELLISYDDYRALTATFRNVILFEYVRGEHRNAGNFNLRKIGPCRLESDKRLLQAVSNNFLSMKTLSGELPPQTGGQMQLPPAAQQMAPPPPRENTIKGRQQCANTIEIIRKQIDKQKQKLVNYRSEQQKVGEHNLFVDVKMNNVVIDCLYTAQQELEQFEVQLSLAERQLQGVV